MGRIVIECCLKTANVTALEVVKQKMLIQPWQDVNSIELDNGNLYEVIELPNTNGPFDGEFKVKKL